MAGAEDMSLGKPDATFSPAPKFDLLNQLIPELILELCDCMPASSAAALALCNHSFLTLLGRSVFAAIKASREQRNLFLQNLSRDLTDAFWCMHCEKIHLLNIRGCKDIAVKDRFLATVESRCKRWWEEVQYERLYRHRMLSLEHLQVAVNLESHGLVSDAQDFLNCTLATGLKARTLSYHPFHRVFESRAFIVRYRRLYARTQAWIFVRKEDGYELPERLNVDICEHLHTRASGFGRPKRMDRNALRKKLACRFSHLSSADTSCVLCRDLLHCERCCTEIDINTKTVKDDFNVHCITMTRWQCVAFGPGTRSTASYLTQPLRANLRNAAHPIVTGDIRDTFEMTTTSPYGSVLDVERAWESIRGESVTPRQALEEEEEHWVPFA